MPSSVIPTPTRHQLRRAASRGLPTVVFLFLCAASAWLWQHQSRETVLVGEVEVVEHMVSSPLAGIVSHLVPSDGTDLGVYVSVSKDQLLIQLDDVETRKQLQQVHDELTEISEELAKEVARLDAIEQVAMHNVAIELDVSEAPSADQKADAAMVESEELRIWRTTQELVEQSLSDVLVSQKELELRQIDFELTQARSAHAAGEVGAETLSQYEALRKAAAEEIFELRSTNDADHVAALSQIKGEGLATTSRLMLRSLINRVRNAEMKLDTARQVASKLDIASPVDGQIEATMVQQLQAVASGQPLLTVVPQRGTTVIVYTREQSRIRPFAGMTVTLKSRQNPQQQTPSVVEFVGPKVEEIPERHRVNPKQIEWGRPLRIPVPAEWMLEPGSLLDVVVEPS